MSVRLLFSRCDRQTRKFETPDLLVQAQGHQNETAIAWVVAALRRRFTFEQSTFDFVARMQHLVDQTEVARFIRG